MRQAGFTLLEILLVVALLGIVTAVVVPTLRPADSAAQLRNDARQFAALVRAGHEQSLVQGKELGISISDTGYQFLHWQQGEWHAIERDRVFQTVELPEAVSLTVTHGDSVWKEALEEEQLTDSGYLSNELFDDDDDEERQQPDLYLWSSGDVSPAEVRFYSASDNDRFYAVRIEETGQTRVFSNTEGEES